MHAQSCKRCQRPILNDPQAQGHCILHAPIPDKDLKKFQQSIYDIIQPSVGAKTKKEKAECNFSHIHFPKGFDYRDLKEAFAHHCSFHEVTFYEEAFFQGVKFEGRAIFSNAVFSETALFDHASFEQGANFHGATFAKNAGFMFATFPSYAFFTGAKFSGRADFTAATFSADANFKNSLSNEMLRFIEAKFLGSAEFVEASFLGGASFNQSTFSTRANFSKVGCSDKNEVYFTAVVPKEAKEVKFHHLDLSRWKFLDTKLVELDFQDVTWARKRRYWIPFRDEALYDEAEAHDLKDKVYVAKLEDLYRQLRLNYQVKGDYSRTSDFYFGEMEMKRLQQHGLTHFLYSAYRFLSGYGERFLRAICLLLLMIFSFALIFMLIGYDDVYRHVTVHFNSPWEPTHIKSTLNDLLWSLIHSTESMFLFHKPDITFNNAWGKLSEIVASVLGSLQIALIILALRRHFRR